jgi:hypothetical protein
MSNYRRTTRECTLEQLRPELARALRDYAQQQQWGSFEPDVLMCCETVAERIATGRFDALLDGTPDECTYLVLIVTGQRLLWVKSGARAGTGAASTKLTDLRLRISRPRRTQDFALDVYGRMEGTRDRVGGQFILGPGPASQKFCDEIMQAINRLNGPPPPRTRPKWLGG